MLGDLEKKPKNASNQKIIIMKSKEYHNINSIIKNLTHNTAFMVWIYFQLSNKTILNSSSKEALDNLGITKKRFQDGTNELINKGYLNWIQDNTWEFIAEPSFIKEEGSSEVELKQEQGSIKKEQGSSAPSVIEEPPIKKEEPCQQPLSFATQALLDQYQRDIIWGGFPYSIEELKNFDAFLLSKSSEVDKFLSKIEIPTFEEEYPEAKERNYTMDIFDDREMFDEGTRLYIKDDLWRIKTPTKEPDSYKVRIIKE